MQAERSGVIGGQRDHGGAGVDQERNAPAVDPAIGAKVAETVARHDYRVRGSRRLVDRIRGLVRGHQSVGCGRGAVELRRIARHDHSDDERKARNGENRTHKRSPGTMKDAAIAPHRGPKSR
jgi:hypothetical protein